MEFVTYQFFFEECDIEIISLSKYTFVVKSSLVIEGEDRLSYITILKLCEAFRDYTWTQLANESSDSICKRISARFFSPMVVDNIVMVELVIVNVSDRGYTMLIKFSCDSRICAIIEMEITLIDTHTYRSAVIPSEIRKKLSEYFPAI